MGRIFVTGSSDGLGQMAAQLLIEQGHQVVLHARSQQRGRQAWPPCREQRLDEAHRTQVWLAMSNEPGALVTSQYFYHKQLCWVNPVACDINKQDALIEACACLSGAPFLY
jgi:NAD(P)-dependent dehydrogenase (short-subunit alcohol dehydrogenase family)